MSTTKLDWFEKDRSEKKHYEFRRDLARHLGKGYTVDSPFPKKPEVKR